ncbi:MAG: hypothetical protein R2722_13285 [Tessaracoccus sp.]
MVDELVAEHDVTVHFLAESPQRQLAIESLAVRGDRCLARNNIPVVWAVRRHDRRYHHVSE